MRAWRRTVSEEHVAAPACHRVLSVVVLGTQATWTFDAPLDGADTADPFVIDGAEVSGVSSLDGSVATIDYLTLLFPGTPWSFVPDGSTSFVDGLPPCDGQTGVTEV